MSLLQMVIVIGVAGLVALLVVVVMVVLMMWAFGRMVKMQQEAYRTAGDQSAEMTVGVIERVGEVLRNTITTPFVDMRNQETKAGAILEAVEAELDRADAGDSADPVPPWERWGQPGEAVDPTDALIPEPDDINANENRVASVPPGGLPTFGPGGPT